MTTDYDLIIVGAGISGSALLYMCTKYTNIQKILVIEKYDKPAQVNSLPSHNSQTLHCGDIETNYTLEKALNVKRAATMLHNYALSQKNTDELIYKYPKMVLGVGKEECDKLKARFKKFSPHYPKLKLLDKNAIHEIEPNVVLDRREDIIALGTVGEYTAVNFEALAKSFTRQAYAESITFGSRTKKLVDFIYDHKVFNIISMDNHHEVVLKPRSYTAKAVVVCAGSHSLDLAHKAHHGLNYSVLPIAGSYYYTPPALSGKVYTVQNDKLPFAAIHGDPDILEPKITRFGPTAIVLPMLERYKYRSVLDFVKLFGFDFRNLSALWTLFKDKDLRNYILKNMMFEIPFIRRWLFLKDARKIIPSLRFKDVRFARKVGGIRPQLVDLEKKTLVMGEAKIRVDDGCIFNITPSPGGTSCLDNAEADMRFIAKHLDAVIFESSLKELHNDTD